MTPDEIRRSWDDDDTPRSVFPEPLAERLTRENKELRAEVERLRRGGKELGRILHRTLTDALDASGRHDCIDEDGDGDWAVVWETLAELRPRAEAAEAEVERLTQIVARRTAHAEQAEADLQALREGLEALAHELWLERDTPSGPDSWYSGIIHARNALNTVLASPPAEGGDEPDGCRLNGCHPSPSPAEETR